MAKVEVSKSVQLSAGADEIWAYISDFSGFAEWQPHIDHVEMQDDGTRKIFFKRGDTILDQVVARDDAARTFTYSVLPGQPTPLKNMDATFRVTSADPGSVVEYAISVEVPDEMEGPANIGITSDIDGALGQLDSKYNG